MPPRSLASPCRTAGQGAVDVAEVGSEPLAEVLALPRSMANPCRSVDEGAVDAAKVDGEPLVDVLAKVWLMSPRSMVSPLPKCW